MSRAASLTLIVPWAVTGGLLSMTDRMGRVDMASSFHEAG
jgi:hypothetical protein